jgi:hypothetical protein
MNLLATRKSRSALAYFPGYESLHPYLMSFGQTQQTLESLDKNLAATAISGLAPEDLDRLAREATPTDAFACRGYQLIQHAWAARGSGLSETVGATRSDR